jgi:molecular chaperone GrpE
MSAERVVGDSPAQETTAGDQGGVVEPGAPEPGRPAVDPAAPAPQAGQPAPEPGPPAPEPGQPGPEPDPPASPGEDDGARVPAPDAQSAEETREALSEQDSAAGAPAPEATDSDLGSLRERAARAEQYLELAQRTKADFENYRRRALREAAAAQERGVAKLAKELLAAIDNLDRAMAAAEAHADELQREDQSACTQLLSGIRLVHADVLAALARVGIEPYSPVGESFDPQFHEAVAQQPFEGAASGTVVEVYQLGYKLGEGVLRPARVMVAA